MMLLIVITMYVAALLMEDCVILGYVTMKCLCYCYYGFDGLGYSYDSCYFPKLQRYLHG